MTDIVQLKQNGKGVYMKTHGKAIDGLVDSVYPVGSIYITVNDNNPANFLGGVWESFASGQTIFGVNTGDADFTPGKSGGSKTQELMAKIGIPGTNLGKIYGDFRPLPSTNRNGSHVANLTWSADSSVLGSASGGARVINSNGKNPSNLPPYISVYMWRRTA